MTVVLVGCAVVLVVVAIVATLLYHHRDPPFVDGFNHGDLKRVIERHERENQNLGRE